MGYALPPLEKTPWCVLSMLSACCCRWSRRSIVEPPQRQPPQAFFALLAAFALPANNH